MEKMNIEIETVTASSPSNNDESLNLNINKNDYNQNCSSFPIDENNNNSNDINKNDNNNIIKMENLLTKASRSSSPPLSISSSSKSTTTTAINVTSNSTNSTNTTNTLPINADIITGEVKSSSTANLNNSASHTNKFISQSENNTMKKNSEKPMALIEANDSNEMYLIVNTIKKLFPNVNIHLCFNNNFFKEGK
jgi:hypothetical protein